LPITAFVDPATPMPMADGTPKNLSQTEVSILSVDRGNV